MRLGAKLSDVSSRVFSMTQQRANGHSLHGGLGAAVGNLLSITRATVPANNGLAILSFAPKYFSPTSVQLKSEINGAFPCKRHQKQHLEFCTTLLRTRRSGVRVPRAHHLFLLSHSLTDDRFLLNFGRGRNVMKT